MAEEIDPMANFLSSQAPTEAVRLVRSWQQDATDVLAWADLMLTTGFEEHAIAFYQDGLQELQDHPERVAGDTNLLGAWVRLFRLLAQRGRNAAAIQAYFMAEALGNNDPADKLVVALSLHAVGRFSEALKIAEWILATRPEFAPGTIKSPEQAFALASQLRADCLRNCGAVR